MQPEGLFAEYRLAGPGSAGSITTRIGEYVILEQSTAKEARSTVLELSTSARLFERTTGRLSIGYSHYTDATPDGSRTLLAQNAGNAGT